MANFMAVTSKLPKRQVSMEDLMKSSKSLLAEATDLQKVKSKHHGALTQAEHDSVAAREQRMHETLQYLKQQEKIKQ